MTTWTTPITWTAGALVTKAMMDEQIRDNMNFLFNTGRNFVIANDTKASGTNGGTATSGAWRTRTLNTLAYDSGSIASLGSNQLTLDAGTYVGWINAPASSGSSVAPGLHQARLQNITAGTTIWYGSTQSILTSSGVGTYETNSSVIYCIFTLAVASALEVQHQVTTTVATTGFGAAASFGGTEQYTQAMFVQIND
jgi:hypothetical protein